MSQAAPEGDPLSYIRSAQSIRDRCGDLYKLGLAGALDHFDVRPERLDGIVSFVRIETNANYPDLNVPYHSRWRHFNAGDIDRVEGLNELLRELSPKEKCRAKIELAIVSALLSAGAGTSWAYQDIDTSIRHKRSEGLALASLYAFWEGLFGESLAVTGARLKKITVEELGAAFQVSAPNILPGLEGRCALLNGLGRAIEANKEFFIGSSGRLGGILEVLVASGDGRSIEASTLLSIILRAFDDIWPNRLTLRGKNLGDVWRHRKVGGGGEAKGLVPLHTLSQWMAYSLVEPLEEFGIEVKNLDRLTGLAEYRNGGLFIDGGALTPKDPAALTISHAPASELVIEWRALTVCLLDEVAKRFRAILGKTDAEFCLSKVLQGGTWSAGRKFAAGRRADGSPPIKIESDGTVF
jgi:hypothetical protein